MEQQIFGNQNYKFLEFTVVGELDSRKNTCFYASLECVKYAFRSHTRLRSLCHQPVSSLQFEVHRGTIVNVSASFAMLHKCEVTAAQCQGTKTFFRDNFTWHTSPRLCVREGYGLTDSTAVQSH